MNGESIEHALPQMHDDDAFQLLFGGRLSTVLSRFIANPQPG
jgi:hypothetical protein